MGESTHTAREAQGAPTTSAPTWPGGMGPPVIVIGAGDGVRISTLLQGSLAASRQPIVVLSAASEDLESDLWRQLRREPRLRVARDDDLVRGLRSAFSDDPALWIDGAMILPADDSVVGERMDGAVRALAEFQRGRMRQLEASFANWRSGSGPAAARSLFVSADRSTTALRHLGREMSLAFARFGGRGAFHESDLFGDPFRPTRRLQAFPRGAS